MANKKLVLIIAVAAIFVLAAGIIWRNMSKDTTTIPAYKGQVMLLKCNTPDCEAVFEMPMRDYYVTIEKKLEGFGVPGLQCKKCGKDTAYRAVKCEKCQVVSFYGANASDFADRCAKCGFSKTEDERKAASVR